MSTSAESNSYYTYQYLVSNGYPPEAAAGIVGNLIAESRVNPTATGDNGTSYGIAQWHNERWTKLKEHAQKRGTAITDLATQISFMMKELRETGLDKRLKNMHSSDQAAQVFMLEYERPANKDPKQRQMIARAVLAGQGNYKDSATTAKNTADSPGYVATKIKEATGMDKALEFVQAQLKNVGVAALAVVFIILGVVVLTLSSRKARETLANATPVGRAASAVKAATP